MGVEADQGVAVWDGTGLQFDDLDEADPYGIRIDPGGFQLFAQCAAQGDGEASPQFGQVPGEQHMPDIVIALLA